MTLESLDDAFRRLVEQTIDFQRISIKGQHGLECFDRLATAARSQKTAAAHGLRFDAVYDA